MGERVFVSPDGGQRRSTGDPATAVRWQADGWREEPSEPAEPARRSRRSARPVEDTPLPDAGGANEEENHAGSET